MDYDYITFDGLSFQGSNKSSTKIIWFQLYKGTEL